MTQFVQLLVLGMATGGFYTINALGVVVVFRSSGIINFAAGGSVIVAGYMEWQLADDWHLPRIIAILGAIAAAALVNLLVYLLAVRRLSAASTLTQVIATLAVLVSLQQAAELIWGSLPKIPSSFLPTGAVHLGPISQGADSLITLAFAALLTMVLWVAYRRSRFGLATSALAENPRTLAGLGWNIAHLRAVNWCIGGALAGAAGVGLAPILQLSPATFAGMLIPTLASAIIGGLRSFPLTLLGGLLIGAAQAEAGLYLTWNGSSSAVPFVLIVLVLMFRGRKLPLRSFVQERLPRVGTGEIPIVGVLCALAFLSVLSYLVTDEWVIGATITLFSAVLLLSQLVITGYAGQLSLAQLTMAGVGAIVAARVAAAFHTPFLVTMLVGMLAVVPVSVVVGLPSLRARGVSLAVATLGFALVIESMVLLNDDLNGGATGLVLDPPSIFGISLNATLYPRRYFIVSLVVFALLANAVANLRRGRVGRRLLAVRTNERAAAALGINVTGAKLYAFVVAGVIAGAGGALLILSEALPQFNGFDPQTGLSSLVNSVLGGIGYVPGAIFGGLFANNGLPQAILDPLVGQLTWWTTLFPLVVGLMVAIQLAQGPDGVADVLTRGGRSKGRRARGRRRRRVATVGSGPGNRVAIAPSAPIAREARWAATNPRSLPTALSMARPAAFRQRAAARRQRRYLLDVAAAQGKPRVVAGATLRVENMTVRFGAVTALDGVSISVAPGEVVAVIGPNGAGKTTLMDAITGFVDASGTIALGDRRIERLPANRRSRAGIARSFQSLELLEDMTVMDNLRCAADEQDAFSMLADLVHPQRTGVSAAMATAITTFGLQDKLGLLPTEIGYGDRRLVAIARAVAGEPAVLMLDEPAAGLSQRERGEVARIITMMSKEWNIAVLLIEHDMEMVRRVADRAIALDFGRPIAQGRTDDVLDDPAVIEAYLGRPATDEVDVTAEADRAPGLTVGVAAATGGDATRELVTVPAADGSAADGSTAAVRPAVERTSP